MKYFGKDILDIVNGGTGASNSYLASLNTKNFYLDLPDYNNTITTQNKLDNCIESGTYNIKIIISTEVANNINMLARALNGYRLDEMQDQDTANTKEIIGTLIVLNTFNEDESTKIHQLIFGNIDSVSGIFYRSSDSVFDKEFINITDSIDEDLKNKIDELSKLATFETPGLMSPEDKLRLNNIDWRFGIENGVPYVESLLGTAIVPIKPENILSVEAGGTGVNSYSKIKNLLYQASHDYPENQNIDFNELSPGQQNSLVYLQGVNQTIFHTPLGNTDIVSYYNVNTYGSSNRVTQTATLPFSHQQGAYIRFKHDSIWYPWMQMISSNENMLINWDFTNPIDQRGNLGTKIDNNLIYCMDRWRIATGIGNNTVDSIVQKSDYRSLSCISVTLCGQWAGFTQLIYLPPFTPSQTYTLSFLFACTKEELLTKLDSHLYIHKDDTALDKQSGLDHRDITVTEDHIQEFIWNGFLCCLVSLTFTESVYGEGKYINCGLYQNVDTKTEVKLFAAKLEKGQVSTLPVDAVGMNHDKEYQKCLRYYYGIFNKTSNDYVTLLDTYAWSGSVAYPAFYLPVPMRRVPNLYYNNVGIQLVNGGYPQANIAIEQFDGCTGFDGVPFVKLSIRSADSTTPGINEHWLVNIRAYGYIAFDAEI